MALYSVLYGPAAAAPSIIHADASGSLSLTGAATAVAHVKAAATGVMALAGTATAKSFVHAATMGALQLAGASGAHIMARAATAGQVAIAGAAAASVPMHATVDGRLALVGNAQATDIVHANASGALAFVGSAAVRTLPAITIDADGEMPLVGVADLSVTDAPAPPPTPAIGGYTMLGIAPKRRMQQDEPQRAPLQIAVVGQLPLIGEATVSVRPIARAQASAPPVRAIPLERVRIESPAPALTRIAAAIQVGGSLRLTGGATGTVRAKATARGAMPLAGSAAASVRLNAAFAIAALLASLEDEDLEVAA